MSTSCVKVVSCSVYITYGCGSSSRISKRKYNPRTDTNTAFIGPICTAILNIEKTVKCTRTNTEPEVEF